MKDIEGKPITEEKGVKIKQPAKYVRLVQVGSHPSVTSAYDKDIWPHNSGHKMMLPQSETSSNKPTTLTKYSAKLSLSKYSASASLGQFLLVFSTFSTTTSSPVLYGFA